MSTEGEAARLLSYVFVQLRADDETILLNENWPLELNYRVKGLFCRVVPFLNFLALLFFLRCWNFQLGFELVSAFVVELLSGDGGLEVALEAEWLLLSILQRP